MAGRNTPSGREAGTPRSMPEGTPSLASPTDHSWTLQAIMEMQKSVGVLGEKVDRLSQDIRGLDTKIEGVCEKIDKVKHWQTLVTGGAIVVGAVVAIVWSVITFVPWDRIHFDASPTEAKEKSPAG